MKLTRLLILAGSLTLQTFAQISISQTDIAYTENFSTLGTSATASLPSNWRADTQTTARVVGAYSSAVSATARVGGNSLSSSAGNGIYNFGAGVSNEATDRAVGFLSSGSATKSGNLYAYFQNNTGGTISSWNISYDVEQYRNGSNSAGFGIQLYYSTDGSTWTSAGSDFLSQFSANADNNGYASAPGSSQSVTAKTLNYSVASGGALYLAWNYAVTSTTTTSNAQALAVDNFSITAAAAAIPEPSTYAAIFGGLALAGVAVRRRFARR